MKPEAFRDWRSRNDLTQREAAELLGKSPRQIRYYEAGTDQRGNKATIPRAVWLACWAIDCLTTWGQEEWNVH